VLSDLHEKIRIREMENTRSCGKFIESGYLILQKKYLWS